MNYGHGLQDRDLAWQQFEQRIMEKFRELKESIREIRETQHQVNARLNRIETTLAERKAVEEDRASRIRAWRWWIASAIGLSGAVYGIWNLVRAVNGH